MTGGADGMVWAAADLRVVYRARRGKTVEALKGVSLAVKTGRVVGLVGRNGAGKTTILEVAAGALVRFEGSARWFGVPLLNRTVRRRMGYCPAVPALPSSLTVREVLLLFAGLHGLSRSDARTSLEELVYAFQLDSILDQRVSTLSTGNIVRVGLAQALIGRPGLLLLDESFAALDPQAQVGLRTLLRRLADGGCGILVSSHQLDQLDKVADELYLIHEGRVVHHVEDHRPGAPIAGTGVRDLEAFVLSMTEGA